MLIGKISSFVPFKGFDYSFDRPAVPERHVYDEELGKPNVFRDEELFDDEEDVIVFCKETFPQDYKKVVKSLVIKDANNNQIFLRDEFKAAKDTGKI